MSGKLCLAQELAKLLESIRILVVTVDVIQQREQFGEGGLVYTTVLLETLACVFSKLVE